MPNPYSTPEEIYALAAEAGIVPMQEPPPIDQAAFIPGLAGGDTGAVLPGELTPPDVQLASPEPDLLPMSSGSSVGVRQSYRGYSPEAAAQVAANPFTGRMGKQVAATNAAVAGAYAPIEAGTVAAAQGLKEGTSDVARAQGEIVTQEGRAASIESALNAKFAEEEFKANVAAKQQGDIRMAQYEKELADYRAQRVNPGQLWSNMSGGQKFGMLVSAFVQDFLGSAGIKTSAMETFNKAIDRNIESQILAIKTKGEVAEGFKSLYYMQRNQAASEAEARARVKPFLLQAAKDAAISEMAKYKSALYTAESKKSIALIDKAMVDSLGQIRMHIQDDSIKWANQALEKYKADLQAATAANALAFQKQQYEDAQKAAAVTDGRVGLLYDTSVTGDRSAKWVRANDTSDEQWKQLKTSKATAENYQALSREYQELRRKFGRQGPFAGTRWGNEDDRRLKAVASRMAFMTAKAVSGLTITDTQLNQIKLATPEELFGGGILGGLTGEQTIAQTERQLLQEFDRDRDQYALPLAEDDSRRKYTVPETHVGPLARQENIEIEKGQDPATKTTEKAVVLSEGTGAASDKDLKDAGTTRQAMELEWENYKAKATGKSEEDANAETALFGIPEFAVGITVLKDRAVAGDKAALEKLDSLAHNDDFESGKFDGLDAGLRKNYALLMLHAAAQELAKKPAESPPPEEPPYVAPGAFTPAQTKYQRPSKYRSK